MKKLIFLSIFLLFTIIVKAQFTFKAEAVATSVYSHVKEEMDDWDEWRKSDVIVFINLDSSNVQIFTELEQKYTIIGAIVGEMDGKKALQFDCIDPIGARCTIELVYLEENIFHLYIRWKYLHVVYQIRKI